MRNKQAGKRGFVAPHEAEKNILKVIEWHRSLKEPIPFGMSEKIWDLDSYKTNFDNYCAELERIERTHGMEKHIAKQNAAARSS